MRTMIRARKLLIVLAVIIVFLLVVEISTLPTSPRLTVDGQPTGFQKDKLMEVANEVTTTEKNLHSLIIERHGKIALELYRNGWNTSLSDGGGIINLWSTIEPETIHDVRSTTKVLWLC